VNVVLARRNPEPGERINPLKKGTVPFFLEGGREWARLWEYVATLEKSVVIGAPVDVVFDYACEPTKMAEWIPSLVEIRDLIGTGAGQQFGWTYKYVGILFSGQTTVVEYVRNEVFVMQSIGAISSVWAMRFAPHAEGTMLTIDVEYNIPLPVLGKLAERLVLKRDTRTLGSALVNVQDALES
jgi:hypothetical protein